MTLEDLYFLVADGYDFNYDLDDEKPAAIALLRGLIDDSITRTSVEATEDFEV